jgi:hypothetical protein
MTAFNGRVERPARLRSSSNKSEINKTQSDSP